MFFFLLPLSLVSLISADGWRCPDEVRILLDISKGTPVVVPPEGTAPEYDTNMKCSYRINIPDGKYATVDVTANFGFYDEFRIWNGLGYDHMYSVGGDIPQNYSGTFYLPAAPEDSFIELTSKKDPGTLKFIVTLHDLPQFVPEATTEIVDQLIIPLTDFKNYKQKVFNSNSLYVFRVAAVNDDLKFDSCFVYSGKNANTGMFLTGLSKQADGIPLIQRGQTTVVCLSDDFPMAYLIATPVPVGMDELSSWAIRTGNKIVYSLEPYYLNKKVFHDAYLSVYCPGGCNQYLTSIMVNNYENGTLQLYNGSPSPSSKLVKLETFSTQDWPQYLPQRMTGEWITYVAVNGSVMVRCKPTEERWAVAKDGRKGFFSSNNYGVSSNSQAAKTTINTPNEGLYLFSYTVQDVDEGSVEITISQGNETTKKTITAANITQNAQSTLNGTSFSIEYIPPNGKLSTGALVSFEMTYKTASGRFFGLATLLLLISKC